MQGSFIKIECFYAEVQTVCEKQGSFDQDATANVT